jgi:hypothetical protein
MVRRLVLLLMLAGALAVLAGAGGSYEGRYAKGRASYSALGAAAAPETLSYIVGSKEYPNTEAESNGWVSSDMNDYDVRLRSDDGQSIKWGTAYRNAPNNRLIGSVGVEYRIITSPCGGEESFNWGSAHYIAFLWFSLEGVSKGDQIANAFICANGASFGSNIEFDAGEYVRARLDTVPEDYRMLNHTFPDAVGGGSTDSCRVDIAWNYAIVDSTVTFDPTLNSRNEWLDFGIPTGKWDDATISTGEGFRLDVTDALQAVVDRGHADRGALFAIYLVGTFAGTLQIAAGDWPSLTAANGAPVLVFDTISRRGQRVWDSDKHPVALCWDDNANNQPQFFDKMEGYTDRVTFMTYGTEAASVAWDDSLYLVKSSKMDLVHHSWDHTTYGSVTGGALDVQLSKSWMGTEYAGLDTTQIIYTAWPGNPAMLPQKSIEAVKRIIDFGYLGARATTMTGTPIGDDIPLRWDQPTCLYNIYAFSGSAIFSDGGAPGDKAYIAAQLRTWVDRSYRDGMAPTIIYVHDYGRDRATPAGVEDLVEVINETDFLELVPFSDLVDMRRSGCSFIDPSTTSLASAVWDSIYDDGYTDTWIEAK